MSKWWRVGHNRDILSSRSSKEFLSHVEVSPASLQITDFDLFAMHRMTFGAYRLDMGKEKIPHKGNTESLKRCR